MCVSRADNVIINFLRIHYQVSAIGIQYTFLHTPKLNDDFSDLIFFYK